MIDQVINYALKNNRIYLKDLFELLRIPSVSMEPKHNQDMQKARNWLVKYMNSIGLEHVQLVNTNAEPIVYGNWLHAKGKPTVLIYGHYDVQPEEPVDLWKSSPFKPEVRGKYLYGRGTADNKCQHFIALAAVASYLKVNSELPVNIKFAIEGGEETGSKGFSQALVQNKKLFSHDVSLIIDFGMPNTSTPSIGYGLRGILYTEIILRGPKRDLHSGLFGGVVENPALALADLLASFKDSKHRITISNFYDDVIRISSAEKSLLSKYPRSEADIKKDAGVERLIHEPGITPELQKKIRPSLDVNGIISGFIGEGGKTIIPAQAMAKVSMRLVPNQHPEKIFHLFRQHIVKRAPKTMSVEIKKLASEPAVLTNYHQPEIKAISRGLEKAFYGKTVFNRSGGSIPAAGHISKIYNQPLAMIGFSTRGDNLHSPNENFYLPNFQKGIEAMIRILHELSSLS